MDPVDGIYAPCFQYVKHCCRCSNFPLSHSNSPLILFWSLKMQHSASTSSLRSSRLENEFFLTFLMKTIYKTITVLIYHKEIHMYKDLLRDAQSLFHNRCSFWEIFTNYPTIGYFTIVLYLSLFLVVLGKREKEWYRILYHFLFSLINLCDIEEQRASQNRHRTKGHSKTR